ncbi:hypothetical protein ACFQ22_03760 [Lentilactobacillus raoultii]|uniref:Uncharacterized protein n=1 Tax=Lentilactobacillus raoultii TaxID=1987503 RepID=A0ABW3PJE2_9LACO|nr:hypothetical protein [Lentilactobacillus raoultii]
MIKEINLKLFEILLILSGVLLFATTKVNADVVARSFDNITLQKVRQFEMISATKVPEPYTRNSNGQEQVFQSSPREALKETVLNEKATSKKVKAVTTKGIAKKATNKISKKQLNRLIKKAPKATKKKLRNAFKRDSKKYGDKKGSKMKYAALAGKKKHRKVKKDLQKGPSKKTASASNISSILTVFDSKIV